MRNKITLVLLIIVFIAAVIQSTYAVAEQPKANIKIIKISFKLDPRLTRGVYMGERWVSPPEYIRVQERGKELKVEARAFGVDTRGRQSLISPEWKSANDSVIRVTPADGQSVEIVVLREGVSKVRVIFGDESKELDIKAVRHLGALRVDITQ